MVNANFKIPQQIAQKKPSRHSAQPRTHGLWQTPHHRLNIWQTLRHESPLGHHSILYGPQCTTSSDNRTPHGHQSGKVSQQFPADGLIISHLTGRNQNQIPYNSRGSQLNTGPRDYLAGWKQFHYHTVAGHGKWPFTNPNLVIPQTGDKNLQLILVMN